MNDAIYILLIICIITFVFAHEYHTNPFAYTIDYKKDIYPEDIFRAISEICNTIRKEEMAVEENEMRRLIYSFKKYEPKFVQLKPLLFSDTLIDYIRRVTGKPLEPCLTIPVEYRKYLEGSHMPWHSDIKMLKRQYQYECVITIHNTSDSITQVHNLLYIKDIHSEPNSLMITRAHGPVHKVTPVTCGERSIIKFAFYDPQTSKSGVKGLHSRMGSKGAL